MEDRHDLSEPRPVKGLELPTWDVDVLREGVDTPILTVRVDAEVLPPRRRKKKIVWKLPDSVDQVPKFGKEDKLRILEIFKQQKKNMKREKRKSQPCNEQQPEPPDAQDGQSQSNNELDASQNDDVGLAAEPSRKVETQDSKTSSTASSMSDPPDIDNLCLEEKKQSDPKPANDHAPPATNNVGPPSFPPPPPPGMFATGPQFPAAVNSTPISPPPRPPPGLVPPAPPGLRQSSSSPSNVVPSPQPGIQPPGATTTVNNNGAQSSSPPPAPTIRHETPPMPRRSYFQLPHPHHPDLVTNLAQVVTQSYYFMLTHGHVQELQSYYAPYAQKSLTVGGAHAICHSVQDLEMQLQSLVGMVVAIRGMLQQPSIPTTMTPTTMDPSSSNTALSSSSSSILVIITGMCVRPHALPFCHSLVLVPSQMGTMATPNGDNTDPAPMIGWQIQNDALCFLTTEAPAAAPPPPPVASGHESNGPSA